MSNTGTDSRLLASLARLTHEQPHVRKRLLGVDVNHGRELLFALAQRTGGWVGWEATTVRSIADALAFVPMHERGIRVASDVEISALVSHAFDRAVAADALGDRFKRLGRYGGFRKALQDSILELRVAAVTTDDLRRGARHGSPAAELAPVLDAYEGLLAEGHLTDPAGVFTLAVEMFEREAPFVLDGVTALVPTVSTRGVAGALVQKLLDAGAELLEIDRAVGARDARDAINFDTALIHRQGDAFARSALGWSLTNDLPAESDPRFDAALVQCDLFAASTPTEELREVCRRVMADGLRWDAVEIVAINTDLYGIALDAIAQQLGIGVTMLKGVPLIRTRLGRALERWCAWLGEGLPADVLRQALEAGEIDVAGITFDGHAVARELRAQRVGWGRARFDALLSRLDTHGAIRVEDDTITEDERTAKHEELAQRRAALAAVLRAVLAVTPRVPSRGSTEAVLTTAAALARSTQAYLTLVPTQGSAEEQTMSRLAARLSLLSDIDGAPTDFASAMAELREGLADLRAWPPTDSARKPYSADGGMLHLTDAPHAGATGRPRTFVVGLDAESAAGGARQDPLVPDAVRRVIGRDRLPDVSDRRRAWMDTLGVAISSLRGRVTLSYAMRATGDGRTAGPSPLMLQVHRVLHRDPTCSFEKLRAELMPPACAVPRATMGTGTTMLDRRDVWLHAIGGQAVLRDATAVVRAAYPMLRAGLDAIEHATKPVLSASHGLVPEAGAVLDPTHDGAPLLSPSALESLGKCPLQWFYRRGLGITPPDDPEYDAEAWLDALQRGSLLHEVFEAFVRDHIGDQARIMAPGAEAQLRQLTQSTIDAWRELVPPPGEGVFLAESADLHRAARAFLQLERDALARGDTARWSAIEVPFGYDAPAFYRLADGRLLPVRGRADRVDANTDGTLRVVDYKTGKPDHYRPGNKVAAYNGGRLLQPALYAEALGGALRQRVSSFEYRFPTVRGGNAIVGFDAASLAGARDVISDLVDHVSLGRFVPTTDAKDCRYCDHAPICRVSTEGFEVRSPRAEWAATHAESLAEYASMLRRRAAAAGAPE